MPVKSESKQPALPKRIAIHAFYRSPDSSQIKSEIRRGLKETGVLFSSLRGTYNRFEANTMITLIVSTSLDLSELRGIRTVLRSIRPVPYYIEVGLVNTRSRPRTPETARALARLIHRYTTALSAKRA